jgi:3-hexulose-6-phosphate synthase / 6-phospho-3-hexuloisomerase
MNETFRASQDFIETHIKKIIDSVSTKEVQRIISEFFKVRRIFVYGAGRSGLVARAFAIRLVHLGFQTFVIGETIGAPVQKDDLVFLISGSGETIPAVMTAEIAHKIGATVVAVTGEKNSRITKDADITLILAPTQESDIQPRYAPLGTLFEASTWILLDSIIAQLMDDKKETEESMRSRHATLELP